MAPIFIFGDIKHNLVPKGGSNHRATDNPCLALCGLIGNLHVTHQDEAGHAITSRIT